MILKWLRVVFVLLITISVNAGTSRRIGATIPVRNSPAGLAITPDNHFAYVANNNNAGIPGGDTVSVNCRRWI